MKPYEILQEAYIIDLAIYLKKYETLVLGDLHIGMEEALNQKGIFIPRFQFKELMERLERILHSVNPKQVILIGDVKHEFGTITNEEWRNITKLVEYINGKATLKIVKGNHDTTILPIAKKKNIPLSEYIVIGEYYLCHGHKEPKGLGFKKSKTIIIGHEHPAIGLRDGPRVELYKCFLLGKYKRKNLIVLPSLSTLSEGTDVSKEELLSPLLKNVKDFKFYIVTDKVYEFGRVREALEY